MFRIIAVFEDIGIDANGHPKDGHVEYDCTIKDMITGACKKVQLTDRQLSMVLQFNLDNNGEPPGFEEFYKELEPIFAGWLSYLRPIP